MKNPPAEWQFDVLFGMVESMSVMISALIAHQQERDALAAHMDFRIAPVRTAILNADRTDLTLEAFDEMNAAFRSLIQSEFEGWDQSWKVFQELKQRLARGGE